MVSGEPSSCLAARTARKSSAHPIRSSSFHKFMNLWNVFEPFYVIQMNLMRTLGRDVMTLSAASKQYVKLLP